MDEYRTRLNNATEIYLVHGEAGLKDEFVKITRDDLDAILKNVNNLGQLWEDDTTAATLTDFVFIADGDGSGIGNAKYIFITANKEWAGAPSQEDWVYGVVIDNNAGRQLLGDESYYTYRIAIGYNADGTFKTINAYRDGNQVANGDFVEIDKNDDPKDGYFRLHHTGVVASEVDNAIADQIRDRQAEGIDYNDSVLLMSGDNVHRVVASIEDYFSDTLEVRVNQDFIIPRSENQLATSEREKDYIDISGISRVVHVRYNPNTDVATLVSAERHVKNNDGDNVGINDSGDFHVVLYYTDDGGKLGDLIAVTIVEVLPVTVAVSGITGTPTTTMVLTLGAMVTRSASGLAMDFAIDVTITAGGTGATKGNLTAGAGETINFAISGVTSAGTITIQLGDADGWSNNYRFASATAAVLPAP
jgi:hypothetical protein